MISYPSECENEVEGRLLQKAGMNDAAEVPDRLSQGRSIEPGQVNDKAACRMDLLYALNPFDHKALFLRGFEEWGRGLDARLSGRRLPDKRLLGLFAVGFRSGALRLVLIEVVEGLDRAGQAEVSSARDCGGNENDGRGTADVAGSHGSLLSRASIPQIAGFGVLSCKDGFLQGHLLYLRPEHRGRGLCGAYFDAVLDLARRQGLRGFQFLSTLPKWSKGEYPFERRFHLRQEDGTVVWRYRRMA